MILKRVLFKYITNTYFYHDICIHLNKILVDINAICERIYLYIYGMSRYQTWDNIYDLKNEIHFQLYFYWQTTFTLETNWYGNFLKDILDDKNISVVEWRILDFNAFSRIVESDHPPKVSFPGMPTHATVVLWKF